MKVDIRKGLYALFTGRREIFSHVLSSISFTYSLTVNSLLQDLQRKITALHLKQSETSLPQTLHFMKTSTVPDS